MFISEKNVSFASCDYKVTCINTFTYNIMVISYIKLHNWKNFQNCSVALAERCFIVGANATGKSNFLDALRFLRDIVKKGGGLQTAVESRGGITKIRCLAARVRTDVEIEVTLREKSDAPDKWKYTLNFKHTGGGIRKNEVTVNRESVWLLTENRCLLDRTENSENETDDTLKYTHLEQAVTSQQFLELRNALADIEYLNIVPQMVRESSLAPETKEDYYGRNFLSELSKLNEATRNSYLRKVNEVLKCAVPQLDNLSFVKDENGFYHLEAKYLHWRAQGSKQTEAQFSDGTLRLIGLLFSILAGKGIALLEEPEINLHPGVVAQLPEFIARMQRHRPKQIIVTTHSYDILSNEGIDETEVVLLLNSDEGTLAKTVDGIDEVKEVLDAGLSMADAVLPVTRPDNLQNIGNVSLD